MRTVKIRILAMLLAAVMLLTCFPATALAEPCYHTKTPTKFDYQRNSSEVGDIYTYALCPDCGQWYLYCYPNTTGVGGHQWVQTDFAYTTCTTDGYYTIECQYCHAKETVVTDKAYGHQWGPWTIEKDPTCTEDGIRSRTCEECYEVEKQHTPATGHKWGEWIVTKPAGHGQKGEEERECSVCHEKETQEVDGEEALAKVGDSSLTVLVAQQLLADGGEFTGTVNGIFGEDLADAIRKYEKSEGLTETGEIFKDTLELLSGRYVGSFEDGLTPDGLLGVFDSGLTALLYLQDHCMSNGDGTHDNDPRGIGVRYLLGAEELDVFLYPKDMIFFDSYKETCSLGNETHTCPKCGYHAEEWETTSAAADDLAFLNGSSFILTNLDTDLGLPEIENLFYDEFVEFLSWDVFPGTKYYEVDMKLDGTTPVIYDTEDLFLSMAGYAQGTYTGTVQAYGEDGEPISNATGFSFFYLGNKMPDPQYVTFVNGAAAWDYPYAFLHASFRVELDALIPGANGQDDRKELYAELTEDAYRDFTELYAKYPAFPKGTRLQLSVQAMDAEGGRDSSNVILTEPVPFEMPDYYKATAAVNVRSGPGRTYERIGGLSKGDFVMCWGQEAGEDGTYYVVTYKGQTGYVLSTCLTWIAPKDFTVLVDLSDGRSVSVRANMDGTLNDVDFAQKVKKYAHLVEKVYKENNQDLEWDETLTPDTRLTVKWKRDPSYVFVTFIDPDGKKWTFKDPDTGKETDEIPVKIGTVCPEKKLFEVNYSRLDTYWTLDREGEGQVINGRTKFTAEMTTVYEHWWKWKDEVDMTVGRTTLNVLDIYKCLFSDINLNADTQVLGMLEEGDKIRLITRDNPRKNKVEYTLNGQTYVVVPDFYKIWCYKLDCECYVLRLALDNYETDALKVHFDADGGWCPVKEMTAQVYRGYGYRTILEMPAAVKDGYVFGGWADEDGNLYRNGSEFRKTDTYLKAKWEVGVEYPTKIGVTVPAHFTADREDIHYRKTPESEERFRIPAGKEVTVIGETSLLYQCLYGNEIIWLSQSNVCINFEKAVYHGFQTCQYLYGKLGKFKYWHEFVIGGIEEGGTYYVVGEAHKGYGNNGGWYYPVVFDPEDTRYLYISNDAGDAEKMASGFAWVPTAYDKRDGCRRHRVVFDPMRGYCDTKETTLSCDRGDEVAYLKSLPVAYLPGHAFEGWYTDPIGGVLVTEQMEITHSMTLYAHYTDAYEAICVATEQAPIYDRTSTSKGNILGYVEIGEVIAVDDQSKTGKFYYTSKDGVSGWVQSRYLEIAKPLIARADPKVDRNIRKSPGKKAKSYRYVKWGEVFFVIDGEGSWSKVAFPECSEGFAWVASGQLYPKNEF